MISTPSVIFTKNMYIDNWVYCIFNETFKDVVTWENHYLSRCSVSVDERMEDADCSVFASAKQLSKNNLNSSPGTI